MYRSSLFSLSTTGSFLTTTSAVCRGVRKAKTTHTSLFDRVGVGLGTVHPGGARLSRHAEGHLLPLVKKRKREWQKHTDRHQSPPWSKELIKLTPYVHITSALNFWGMLEPLLQFCSLVVHWSCLSPLPLSTATECTTTFTWVHYSCAKWNRLFLVWGCLADQFPDPAIQQQRSDTR